jgi:hypothetical protein
MIGQIATTVFKQRFNPGKWTIVALKPSSRCLASLTFCTLSLLTTERSWSTPVEGASTSTSVTPTKIAQSTQFPPSETSPVTEPFANCTTLTDKSLSPHTMNLPTLWWVKEQYAAKPGFGARLIRSWSTMFDQAQAVCRINIVVNRQLWSLLDYLQRYEFVNQVGYEFVNQIVSSANSAQAISNYRVCFYDRDPNADGGKPFEPNRCGNEQVRPVALYRCTKQNATATSTAPTLNSLSCRIGPRSFNRNGLQGTSGEE